ncbi:Uncharacterized membrane protein YphA, DoxX/SURF4 family [Paenibacillus sp. yr247]|uniref:DoxX family protein n=1 Tax=Paenibacillus sp. yr247 TaxID=1761880 RepID=UPI0008864A22|nr:DoxX family protein [Paenibacillus sp. yr247]SDP20726.1 Uncharacterized membrane protein YphA, DoxX/SURF4 family [Paenibacillus sp. yr247]
MTRTAVVSTVMRVVMGVIFLAHGVVKCQIGLNNVEAWFISLGLPGFLAYVVATLELVGGALLILGLFTRYVSALLIILMIGAIFSAKLSAPLVSSIQTTGYEVDIGFILILLYLIVAEQSAVSVDRLFTKKRSAQHTTPL